MKKQDDNADYSMLIGCWVLGLVPIGFIIHISMVISLDENTKWFGIISLIIIIITFLFGGFAFQEVIDNTTAKPKESEEQKPEETQPTIEGNVVPSTDSNLTSPISTSKEFLPREKRPRLSILPRNQIFVSYSHQDKEWLQRLQTHLKPFSRNSKLTIWDDTQIKAGTKWREEIEKALSNAKVAVLLVSPDFLASDFIDKHELPPLLEAAEMEGLIILWIPVRPSGYRQTPIEQYQAIHSPADPLERVIKRGRVEIDEALVAICEKIQEAANKARSRY